MSQDSGGIRQSERQYIPALKAKGLNVVGVVIGDSWGAYGDQREDFSVLVKTGVQSFKGGLISRVLSVLKEMKNFYKLKRKLQNEILFEQNFKDTKVVINIRRISLLLIAYQLSRQFKGKVIFHSGQSFNKGPLSVNRLFYGVLKKMKWLRIIANSQYSALSYGLASDDYVYPGFSDSRISSNPDIARNRIREEFGIDDSTLTFLYMARLHEAKAPDILIEAFGTSSEVRKNKSVLILAGGSSTGDYSDYLQEKICSLGMEKQIKLVGKVDNVSDWYAASDVFVNSRRGVEPFGISIVEAMANGLPVIASALGGPSETVSHQENGFLVSDSSVDGYREFIDKIHLDKGALARMSEESVKRAQYFTLESQIERYLLLVME